MRPVRGDRFRRSLPQIAFALPLTLVTGCAISHAMRLGPPASGCPAEGSAQAGSLTWFQPVRSGDRRTLEKWCSAVGPPVFLPTPAASASRAGDPDPDGGRAITVATWNVHVGAADIPVFLETELGWACSAPARDGSQGGLKLEGEGRGPPFLLLIQEAYRASVDLPSIRQNATLRPRIEGIPPSGERLDIVETARRCGLALFYVPSMRNGRDAPGSLPEDRGNAILSTFPLTDPAAIEVPFESQRRVAAVAEAIVAQGVSVRLTSVHLDVVSSLLRALVQGGTSRVRQGRGLAEALTELEATHGSADATVVAGDLNTWSSHETVILQLLEAFPDSPPPGDEPTRGAFPADHLFVRLGRDGRAVFVRDSYRIATDDYGSDHRARIGRLHIRD